MKRVDLIRQIERLGAQLVREGGEHTFYRNPRTNEGIAVPRHREINENTARAIIRDASK